MSIESFVVGKLYRCILSGMSSKLIVPISIENVTAAKHDPYSTRYFMQVLTVDELQDGPGVYPYVACPEHWVEAEIP